MAPVHAEIVITTSCRTWSFPDAPNNDEYAQMLRSKLGSSSYCADLPSVDASKVTPCPPPFDAPDPSFLVPCANAWFHQQVQSNVTPTTTVKLSPTPNPTQTTPTIFPSQTPYIPPPRRAAFLSNPTLTPSLTLTATATPTARPTLPLTQHKTAVRKQNVNLFQNIGSFVQHIFRLIAGLL